MSSSSSYDLVSSDPEDGAGEAVSISSCGDEEPVAAAAAAVVGSHGDDSDASSSLDGGRASLPRRGRPKKKFRMQALQFSITYPRCAVEKQRFFRSFLDEFGPLSSLTVCSEKHADGGHHLHVHAVYSQKKDVRSEKYFDVTFDGKKYHPNIQRTLDERSWSKYIRKDGNFISSDDQHPSKWLLSGRGFKYSSARAEYQDAVFIWQRRQQSKLREVDYPIILRCADGGRYAMERPDPAIKKRSWWIVAPPSSGKTRWLNKTFKGQRVYTPRMGKYPYEGVFDEEIIIFDDRKNVSFEEFSDVLNVWETPHPVFGEVRFFTQDWPLGAARSCIVLSNYTIEESMDSGDHGRMKKRFIQIVNPTLLDPSEVSDDEDQPESCTAQQIVGEFCN